MTFFNTTRESGEQLDMFAQKAKTQTEKVYAFMKQHKNQGFTANDVHKALFSVKTPLTSTRRAMSDLFSENLILKTNQKVLESYGRPAYKYIFNPNKSK